MGGSMRSHMIFVISWQKIIQAYLVGKETERKRR